MAWLRSPRHWQRPVAHFTVFVSATLPRLVSGWPSQVGQVSPAFLFSASPVRQFPLIDYNKIGGLDSVTDGSSSSTYDYLYDDLGRTTQSPGATGHASAVWRLPVRTCSTLSKVCHKSRPESNALTLISRSSRANGRGSTELRGVCGMTGLESTLARPVAPLPLVASASVPQIACSRRWTASRSLPADPTCEQGFGLYQQGRQSQSQRHYSR
jgi:hypothetical protein